MILKDILDIFVEIERSILNKIFNCFSELHEKNVDLLLVKCSKNAYNGTAININLIDSYVKKTFNTKNVRMRKM